jgi:hypothetical protein
MKSSSHTNPARRTGVYASAVTTASARMGRRLVRRARGVTPAGGAEVLFDPVATRSILVCG